jgi:hypothetical protein
MKRVLLIFLSLVLALVGWTTVCAQNEFYVISGVKSNYAPVAKTGQTISYAAGDDGAWQKGVPSPTPRFTDNGNGTMTDKLTGLIWMKNANGFGQLTWAQALSSANGLQSGMAGLTDGSKPGDWRLPNVKEFLSLIDYSRSPPLPANHPFTNLAPYYYWSSTNFPFGGGSYAWYVDVAFYGNVNASGTGDSFYVWCVRGGP